MYEVINIRSEGRLLVRDSRVRSHSSGLAGSDGVYMIVTYRPTPLYPVMYIACLAQTTRTTRRGMAGLLLQLYSANEQITI